jgi:hypothetical protein
MISTNNPINGAKGVVLDANGNSWYIDDSSNPAGIPFYDLLGDANSSYFCDSPFMPFGENFWRGYTYMVSGSLSAKELNISSGCVYWGFDDPMVAVPEPSTLALCFFGTAALWQTISRKKPATGE